jgi:hypothetical protein
LTTIEETITKLTELRLTSMATAVRELIQTAPGHQLSFEEKLGIVVDREWTERDNRRIARRLKDAKLVTRASLDSVICDPERGVDQGDHSATCDGQVDPVEAQHHRRRQDRRGQELLRRRASRFSLPHRASRRLLPRPATTRRTRLARAAGEYGSLLGKLSRIHVLVLDDFLLNPMTDAERRDLLEVIEDRYDRSSTVITTQVPRKLGTRRSSIRQSPTPSATASCTTPTCSNWAAPRCAGTRPFNRRNPPPPDPAYPPGHSSLRSGSARVGRDGCSSPAGTGARVERNAQASTCPLPRSARGFPLTKSMRRQRRSRRPTLQARARGSRNGRLQIVLSPLQLAAILENAL